MNVVIVEDEGITALFLEEAIESFGSNVLAVFDEGDGLLLFLESHSIDLIFMDIQINGTMDGIQLANRIQQKYPFISFVFITSFKDTDTIESARFVRPLGYLIKPVTEEELEAVLMVVDGVRQISNLPKKMHIDLGSYSYDIDKRSISLNNTEIILSKNEMLCLYQLVLHRNAQVSIPQLLFSIWGEDENRLSSLRELTYRLRKKLPELKIINTPNVGYTLHTK